MDLRSKLIIGGALALLLGLAFSIPLLVSDLKPRIAIDLTVDVKYAYFGDQPFTQNISGLWRNSSNSQEYQEHLISYIIILNITNNSDQTAYISEFTAAAGPEILVENGITSLHNPIVYDVRAIKYLPAWNEYWSPNSSRLIALTGTVSVHQYSYQALYSGTLTLYGYVEGRAYDSDMYSHTFGLKQVQLQMFGHEFLYNALISGNQLLQITNSFDVSIQSGS